MKTYVVVFMVLFIGLLLVVPDPILALSDSLEFQWSQTYDNYFDASMFQTLDGGFLITGVSDSLQDLLFVKTSCGGEVEWKQTFPTINGAPKLMRSMDFGYYCLLPGGYGGARVLKMDLQGNFEWIKQYDFSGSAAFYREVTDLCVAKDGGFVMVISDEGTRSPWQVSLFKGYDADGVLLWEKSVEDVRVSVVLPFEDGDGGYFVAGWRGLRPWFAKLDSNCEIVWSHTYGSLFPKALSNVRSVIPTSDGGFLLVGSLPLHSRDGVDFIVKVDGKGKALWSQKYDSRIHNVVEVGGGQFLMFNHSEIICAGASGKTLWVEPYSKYFEDSVSLTNVTYMARDVSAFVGGAGSVVVAVPYGVAIGGYTTDLWVVSFAVKPSSFSGVDECLSWMLCGVVGVVVVVVGCLVYYLRKKRNH